MPTELTIGEVSARTDGGRRSYDAGTLDRLYRIRLQRSLGIAVADVAPDQADLLAMQRWLVDVFGFAPGALTRHGGNKVVHAEVHVGDGVIWMHQESPHHRLASPVTSGSASHCMAIDVDDVEAHYVRTRAAGAEIVHEPADMPYGVREYSARDPEGGLWSFMQPIEEEENKDE